MRRIFSSRLRALVFASLVIAGVGSCDSAVVYTDLRVYSSPYANVDWANSARLKSQHHDHIGFRTTHLLAYDSAGYDVLSLMDYSGNTTLPFAWQERLWPPEKWVPASTISSFSSLRFLIPNAEEVGVNQHATSPFLTTYIEGRTGSTFTSNPVQYGSLPEMFEIIRNNGGFPCVAHPWDYTYENLDGPFCAEIFSAFADARRHQGVSEFVATDRNEVLLSHWDRALAQNQKVFGIAVNDHFGPYVTSVPDEIRDSGKIIVLADNATIADYREAFEAGRFFAVRDSAAVKDQYPEVFEIVRDEDSLFIESNGDVRWISHGLTVATGPELKRSEFPPNSRYVRAEISGPSGDTVVYTQAFVVRPVGDVDGDYDIDERDDEICDSIAAGAKAKPTELAACKGRQPAEQR